MTEQLMLDSPQDKKQAEDPVECLGMTFENDEKRREYFLGKLREKLQEPEFRQIDGFPIGSDEDILAMSDPPYYTACPNPFLEDFIQCFQKQDGTNYKREPFTADVSEGKSGAIYSAHSYHTKSRNHYSVPGLSLQTFVLSTSEWELLSRLQQSAQSNKILLFQRINLQNNSKTISRLMLGQKRVYGTLSPTILSNYQLSLRLTTG